MQETYTIAPAIRRPRSRGFSVVEILLGTGLLLTGLLGLASSTVVGTAALGTNRETAEATHAARLVMETLEHPDVPFELLFAVYHESALRDTLEDLFGVTSDTTTSLLKTTGDLLGGTTDSLVDDVNKLLGDTATTLDGAVDTLLRPRSLDVNGRTVEVVFPVREFTDSVELREDVAGRDLNGDGTIDTLDHSRDYKILPVTVRVQWQTKGGTRQLELQTLLTRK